MTAVGKEGHLRHGNDVLSGKPFLHFETILDNFTIIKILNFILLYIFQLTAYQRD